MVGTGECGLNTIHDRSDITTGKVLEFQYK